MMKVICAVKYVPDVGKFQFDFEKNVVIRSNVRMILNPDDAKCAALAFAIKKNRPDTVIEILCMGPKSVLPMIEDLGRLGADKITLISDKHFVGSDSYVTSKILGTYLKNTEYDLILTGNHSLDGDTSHVPPQIADMLDIPQMSNVISVDLETLNSDSIGFIVENEFRQEEYSMELPGVLSLNKDSKYKLPYISYEDMNRSVQDKIHVITNEILNLKDNQIGFEGSLTKVKRTFIKQYRNRDKETIRVDEDGVNRVYDFLIEHGYLGERNE